MLEVYAQLGEIYLVRTAYDGVEECLRRMTDCLAVYQSIRAGTNPEAAAKVTMSDAGIDHMICRYSRRAQFLRTGLAAAAHGDHEAAEAGLLVLTDDAEATFPDLAAEHGFLITYARILCATALCDDDLHVRSVPLWEQVIDAIENIRPTTTSSTTSCSSSAPPGTAGSVSRPAGCRRPSRGFSVPAPAHGSAGMAIGYGENAIGTVDGEMVGGRSSRVPTPCPRSLSRDSRTSASSRRVEVLAVFRPP